MQSLIGRDIPVIAVLAMACASSPDNGGPPPDGGNGRCNPGALPAVTTEVLIGGGSDPAHRIAFPTFVGLGTAISGLQGWYLFCDGYSGGCGALQVSGGGTSAVAHSLPCLSGRLETFTSFGQDNAGELYVVGYTTDAILAGPNDGIVLRIIGG